MNLIDLIFIVLLGVFIYTRFFSDKLPKSGQKSKKKQNKKGNVLEFPSAQQTLADAPKPKKKAASNKTGIDAIKEMDPSFTKKSFLDGAKAAFGMYYTARTEADEETLENLLSPRLLDDAMDDIEELEEKGQHKKFDAKLKGAPEIVDARVTARTLIIDVKYKADIAEYVVNDKTKTTKGAKTPKPVEMIWTWAKSANADDPNWELEAIQQLN